MDIANIFVSLIGFGSLLWIIKGLKSTVEAQGKTIDAQGNLLNGIDKYIGITHRIIDSIDEPRMLERMKAFKETVVLNMQEEFREQKRKLSEEKQRELGRFIDLAEGTVNLAEQLSNLMIQFIVFVPAHKRKGIIDSTSLTLDLKKKMHRLAEFSPDLSIPSPPLGLTLEELLSKTHLEQDNPKK